MTGDFLPMEGPGWGYASHRDVTPDDVAVHQCDMTFINRIYEQLRYAHDELVKGEWVENEEGEEQWKWVGNADEVSAAVEDALNAVEGLTNSPAKWNTEQLDIIGSAKRHAEWIKRDAREYGERLVNQRRANWQRECKELIEAEVSRRIDQMFGRAATLKRKRALTLDKA